MTGPFWNIGPDAGTTSSADGRAKSHYNVLSAEVGKHIMFGPDLSVRFFTGISALWLNQKIIANFAGVDPILGPYTFNITTKSKFNAGGLRFGIDGEYEGWYKIKALWLLAGNIYVGSQQPKTETTGAGSVLAAAGIAENDQFIWHDSYIQIVPSFDAKLGLKYSIPYCRDNRLFSIEGGYMTSVFVNAIQNYVPSTYVPGSLGIVTGSVFLQSMLKTTENYSLDGPYLTASIQF